MSLPVRVYTIHYRGRAADLAGAGVKNTKWLRLAGASAQHRVEVLAASEAQALHRAARLVGGSEHRIVGRAM